MPCDLPSARASLFFTTRRCHASLSESPPVYRLNKPLMTLHQKRQSSPFTTTPKDANMPSSKLKYPAKSHKGEAGRKPAAFPVFWKRFRATDDERGEFSRFLTGDARLDFMRIMYALDEYKDAHPHLFKK